MTKSPNSMVSWPLKNRDLRFVCCCSYQVRCCIIVDRSMVVVTSALIIDIYKNHIYSADHNFFIYDADFRLICTMIACLVISLHTSVLSMGT